jgi:thioredoxin reductase
MTKQITVFEFNKDIEVKQNVKNLITTKQAMQKALEDIKKIERVYSEEISEYKGSMHITRGGDIVFIEDMTNEHLLNTIGVFLRAGYSYNSAGAKKYVKEVKKRGLVSEMLALEAQQVEREDDFIVDDEEEKEEGSRFDF